MKARNKLVKVLVEAEGERETGEGIFTYWINADEPGADYNDCCALIQKTVECFDIRRELAALGFEPAAGSYLP